MLIVRECHCEFYCASLQSRAPFPADIISDVWSLPMLDGRLLITEKIRSIVTELTKTTHQFLRLPVTNRKQKLAICAQRTTRVYRSFSSVRLPACRSNFGASFHWHRRCFRPVISWWKSPSRITHLRSFRCTNRYATDCTGVVWWIRFQHEKQHLLSFSSQRSSNTSVCDESPSRRHLSDFAWRIPRETISLKSPWEVNKSSRHSPWRWTMFIWASLEQSSRQPCRNPLQSDRLFFLSFWKDHWYLRLRMSNREWQWTRLLTPFYIDELQKSEKEIQVGSPRSWQR